MPLYLALLRDSGDATERRQTHLVAHAKHIAQVHQAIAIAGPLRDQQAKIVGSMFVLDLPDLAAVHAWLAKDPYALADIWQTPEVLALTPAAGAWIGGLSEPLKRLLRPEE